MPPRERRTVERARWAAALLVGGLLLLLAGVAGLVPFTATTAPVAFVGHTLPWWLLVSGFGVVTAGVAYASGIAATRRLGARLASFVALTEGESRKTRASVAFVAAVSCVGVLTVFLLAGDYVFKLFGITVPEEYGGAGLGKLELRLPRHDLTHRRRQLQHVTLHRGRDVEGRSVDIPAPGDRG